MNCINAVRKCRVTAVLRRKMSTSIVKPPSAVLGMKELDKTAFTKEIQVPCLYVSALSAQIPSVRLAVKPYLLKLRKFISNFESSENERKFILHPERVLEWDSLEEKHRVLLESKGISKEALRQERITLHYDNWDAHEVISAVVGDSAPYVSGFSRVGHIIHVNLRAEHEPYKHLIGTVLLEKTPNIRTVVNKSASIENEFRNINYELLAGENDLIAIAKENGCTFHVDYGNVYWNPRLCTEHERLVEELQPSSVLYDMFAGIGPFAVPAGKKGCTVLANDLNPDSFQWLQKNLTANKVAGKVTPYNLDAREFVRTVVREDMIQRYSCDPNADLRFAMNLPACADEFLNEFSGLLHGSQLSSDVHRPPTVYLYCFEKNTDTLTPMGRIRKHLEYSLDDSKIIRRFVRQVAPNKDMIRLQFCVPFEVLLRHPVHSTELLDTGLAAVSEPGMSDENAQDWNTSGNTRKRLHS